MQLLEDQKQSVLQQYSPANMSSQDANAAFEILTDFMGVLLEVHQNIDEGINENQ